VVKERVSLCLYSPLVFHGLIWGDMNLFFVYVWVLKVRNEFEGLSAVGVRSARDRYEQQNIWQTDRQTDSYL
jgi:hypothetical protein